MAVGFSKIQKQFLVLIGLFLVLTMVLHLIPVYYDYQQTLLISRLDLRNFVNNHSRPIVVQTSSDKPKSDGPKVGPKSTSNKPKVDTKKVNIWKVVPDDDRIVAQVKFSPYVDPSLPSKRILLTHGTEGWSVASGRNTFIQHDCPVQNCELVGHPPIDRPVDARMFKEIDLNSFNFEMLQQVTPRHPDQVWIMFALESPEATPSYDAFNDVINWTATYRYDSTMITPYDKFLLYDNFTTIDDYKADRNYAAGRTKMAAMFVSNCYAANDRLGFVKELQEHMTVDVYGFCGTLSCEKGDQQGCFDMLTKDYKFYFAFENANCRDYITEKLFLNALRHDVLPVVMGAHPDDYKRMAPPGSYIHVEDFPDAEALANYLIKLSEDEDEYNKYFRWKQAGQFMDTKFWCRICSMLWDPDRPHISVKDLDAWWRGPNICIGKKRWDQVDLSPVSSNPILN